jgi:hypothetical protein
LFLILTFLGAAGIAFAASVTVIVFPATVNVPVSALVVLFAATE